MKATSPIFLAVIAVLACSAAVAADDLTGKWESASRSQGGIGTIFEFRSDGGLSVTPGAMIDFRYRIENDRVTMSFTDPGTGQPSENSFDFSIDGESMTMTEPATGKTTRLTRDAEGAATGSPIVGVWSFVHDSGRRAWRVFTADGAMYLRIPFRSAQGSYRVEGDTITITVPDQPALTVRYSLTRDELTMTREGQPPERYRRASW